MAGATKALATGNALQNPAQLQKTAMEYERQNEMMSVKEEYVAALQYWWR